MRRVHGRSPRVRFHPLRPSVRVRTVRAECSGEHGPLPAVFRSHEWRGQNLLLNVVLILKRTDRWCLSNRYAGSSRYRGLRWGAGHVDERSLRFWT